MSVVYVDASAMGKRLIEESESEHLDRHLNVRISAGDRLLSSRLLVVELHRLAIREQLDNEAVQQVLGNVALVAIPDVILDLAARIPWHVKSLDAIHLGTVQFLEQRQHGLVVELISYDATMIKVARQLGLRTASPAG